MMNTSCIHFHFLLVLSLCCAFSSSILMINAIDAGFDACRPDQIRAIGEFQNEFDSRSCNDSSPFDDFYNCDSSTGSIIELEYTSGCLKGILNPNSSLFKLHHLRRLYISNNNFKSSSLPSGFSNLNRLEVLSLSSNGFVGQLSFSLSNLTQLSQLDLSSNELTGSFPLIQNLSRLSYLDLSSNHFSGPLNPSLFEFGNFNKLELLNLSSNGFQGQLPSFSNLSQLISLDIQDNEFTGINETISKLIELEELDLSFQNISYPVDLNLFSSLKYLMNLYLSGNSILPASLSSDSGLPLNLQTLVFSDCDIHQFPHFLRGLRNLVEVDLSHNKIKGKIPEWFWKLPNLDIVILANNSLTGFEGSAEVLVNSTVTLLDLDLNSFEGPFPNPPHTLTQLSAWNNAFAGSIPLAICNRTLLTILDLSYNNFTGSIPRCLRNFQSSLTVLNLRRNNLEGSLPDMCNNGSLLQTVDVGYNQLTGKLPKSLLSCSSLRFLNVENNKLKDAFPFWLKALPNLQVLILRSNRFYGPMSPPGQGSFAFPGMLVLEISYNNFTGSLPSNYFDNWQTSSFKKNEDGRIYMGDYNHSSYQYEDTLDLRYKGLHMEQESVLTFYATIDFSGNKLEGEIPESIGLLKALIALNLSNNAFTGHIPLSLANVTELESLDLSNNQLSGTIPKELERLSFLAYISVAHNQLKGEIPQGTQITGQPKSSFEGNAGLCGLPLEQSCFGTNGPPMKHQPVQEKEEKED